MSRSRGAFTLIELLVVIAIIALLMALLVPAVQKVREAMNKAKCANNLHQIGLALHNYHESWSAFPPGSGLIDRASVMAKILPFLEQDAKYNLFDFTVTEVNTTAVNRLAREQQIPTYLCPSANADTYVSFNPPIPLGKSSYLANLGPTAWWRSQEGPFFFNSKIRFADLQDGTATTALVSEVKFGPRIGTAGFDDALVSTSVPFGVWDGNLPANDINPAPECENRSYPVLNYTGLQYYRGFLSTGFYTHTVPPNYRGRDCIRAVGFDKGHYASRSYHPGGVNTLFGDGHVRFILDSVDMTVWRGYGSRKGKEVVDF